jgi:hypothetical protein
VTCWARSVYPAGTGRPDFRAAGPVGRQAPARLPVGGATVKTHLPQSYATSGVSDRAAAVARVL